MVFALRAHQAHDLSQRDSPGLMKYWQITFQAGYIGLIGNICNLLQAALVNATRPVQSTPTPVVRVEQNQTRTLTERELELSGETVRVEDGDDLPRARKGFRDLCGLISLVSLVPLTLGIVAGVLYKHAETSRSEVNVVIGMR